MEGLSTFDAVACQWAIHEASCNSCLPQSVSTPSNSNPLIKINSNGTVWIRGVQYQPASPPKPTKVSVAEVDVEAAILQPTKGSMPTGLSLTVTQTGP